MLLSRVRFELPTELKTQIVVFGGCDAMYSYNTFLRNVGNTTRRHNAENKSYTEFCLENQTRCRIRHQYEYNIKMHLPDVIKEYMNWSGMRVRLCDETFL
jgi:hypothetical protein